MSERAYMLDVPDVSRRALGRDASARTSIGSVSTAIRFVGWPHADHISCLFRQSRSVIIAMAEDLT